MTAALRVIEHRGGHDGFAVRDYLTRGDVPFVSVVVSRRATQVHRYTALAPSVALHIPWDHVDDYSALGRDAEDLGVVLGTVNSSAR